MHEQAREDERAEKKVSTILTGLSETVSENQIVEHDRKADTCGVGQSPHPERVRKVFIGDDPPPTEPPVMAIPMVRLRHFMKYCDTTDMVGRKIKPVPIPTPNPWASIVCQYSLAMEIMNRLFGSA